jgi:hypothetical protein
MRTEMTQGEWRRAHRRRQRRDQWLWIWGSLMALVAGVVVLGVYLVIGGFR